VQQHPTVILSGIDTTEPIDSVQAKVEALIKRRWSGYGWPLHGHDGLVVREPKRTGDGNAGICVLRFRSYVDAKWLMKNQKALKLDGRALKAEWAKPKCN